MDANGQRFWLWSDEADFARADTAAHFDRQRRALMLASARPSAPVLADRTAARLRANGPAGAIDPWESWARVSDDRNRILAGGGAEGEVEIWSGAPIHDLALTPGRHPARCDRVRAWPTRNRVHRPAQSLCAGRARPS